MQLNPLLFTDSYKLSHIFMYPDGLEYVQSNYTNRKSRIDGINHVVHFGLQAWLTDLTQNFEEFFRTPKSRVLRKYKQATETFVTPGFTIDHIAALWDLQYVPLRFSAPPEGTLMPIRVPSVIIESTHPEFAWLVNYIESDLSAGIWHPSTVATIAWSLRRLFDKAAEETSSTPEATDFQLHDFSYRGQVNREAAMSSGAAHLLSSMGSDGVPAVQWADWYYPGDNGLIGASVPATEHSVMCAGGRDGEFKTFERLLDLYPSGILSIVSDTWSLKTVITEFLPRLKDKIMARDGKLVIRPDSGNPADIVAGLNTDRDYMFEKALFENAPNATAFKQADEFYEKGAIEALWDIFGGTVNDKGFKELDSHIGLIYGDGMTHERITDINARLKRKEFASTNWVAGVGSYTYQMVTRDTFGSAVKATYVEVNGEGRNIQKDPETDDGTKKSATGKLAVLHTAQGVPYLVEQATDDQIAKSLLQPVWENGKFITLQSFANVRETLKRSTGILERAGVL